MSLNQIKILKDCAGVEEGNIYPTQYTAGQIVGVSDSLLKAFIELGSCELVGTSVDVEIKEEPKKTIKKPFKKKEVK